MNIDIFPIFRKSSLQVLCIFPFFVFIFRKILAHDLILPSRVLDMLRFNKFTVGYAWCSDFGNPDKKEDFEYIYKFSPLHTIPQLKVSTFC